MAFLPRALLAAAVLIALPAPTAEARTMTHTNIQSPSGMISCHAVDVRYGKGIECSAPYLPDIGYLDTYMGLKPRGRSRLAERGDYNGYTARRRTLGYGDVWKRPGIRCRMRRSGMTCRNRDGHGFHLAKGDVRRF